MRALSEDAFVTGGRKARQSAQLHIAPPAGGDAALASLSPLKNVEWEQNNDPITQEKLEFEEQAKAAAEALLAARPGSRDKAVRFSMDQPTAAKKEKKAYVRKPKKRVLSASATIDVNCDKIRDYQKTSEHASEGNAPGQHEEEEEEEEVVVEQSDAEVQTDDLPRSETCDKQVQTLVVKFRSSSRGSSLSSRSAKSGKNDSKKQELSIGALVQESLDLASQTLPEEQTLEEGNGEEGEEEMAAEYEDEYDEEEEEEEEATGGAYELTQKFQAQATKLLEALDSQIAELETELATARRDGDAEAIFEITNALTAKQAERLVLVKFKPDFNIETKMEIFSPAQSPLQSPARRRRAPGQAQLEEDPLVASLQERVQVQQELLVKLQAAASGAGLEQQVEDILEERMDAFVEHRMVRLEQMRAACRFRHLVMQGRNKTLDKREKRMQDRVDKLHSREFDVEEGERKLNEKKVREAAAAERRLLELREAQKEADELDRYRAKLEKERNDLNQSKAALDQQLGEVNFKSRQLLADRKELRKERLEFEKAKQLREMAEARKKNPKLAKKPDQAGDGGKDTDTGNISPPKSPPPKSPQAQNFDLSGDKRVLGVTELCMPLPSVWPGRSPEPKKGPGAISSIFELLQPVGPHHLLARAHGKLPMSAPQPKRAVAKGVCERSPGPDAVSQEQESGPSSAGPSSAGKKKPASSRSISRAAHVPVAADIVGWATEEEHVHSPIPQDRLPQIQDKREAGGRGGEKDQRARSTETDAVQRCTPLQPAPVHPRDTTPTSLVSRAPSVSDAGFDFVAPLVVDEKGWTDSRDGEEGLERRSSLRGFSRGSSSGKNVGFAGLDT